LASAAGSENPKTASQPPERGFDVELVAEAVPPPVSQSRYEHYGQSEDEVLNSASHVFITVSQGRRS
jgi:hypothetical protein